MQHAELLAQLDNPGAKAKISQKFGNYVKDRLREEAFSGKIVPFETIDPSECQVSPNHDTLVKLEYLEPNSRANVISFRGSPNAEYISGKKTLIPFVSVMSNMFQKTEQEFLAYRIPLAKIIQHNSIRDLAEVQDREWLIHNEAAVQALQAEANGGAVTALNATSIAGGAVEFSVVKGDLARQAATDDETVYPILRPDFPRLFNLLDGNRLETGQLLMTKVDFNNTLSWTVEDNGDKIQSETVVEGYKYNMLLGKKVTVSIKSDILRPGNVYSYTDPSFLGRNYILNQVKFWIDKVVNMVKWVCWKDIGMSFVNIAATRKMELFSGDATSLDTDSIQADVTPKDEEDLGAENNRAGDRLYFPQVTFY